MWSPAPVIYLRENPQILQEGAGLQPPTCPPPQPCEPPSPPGLIILIANMEADVSVAEVSLPAVAVICFFFSFFKGEMTNNLEMLEKKKDLVLWLVRSYLQPMRLFETADKTTLHEQTHTCACVWLNASACAHAVHLHHGCIAGGWFTQTLHVEHWHYKQASCRRWWLSSCCEGRKGGTRPALQRPSTGWLRLSLHACDN